MKLALVVLLLGLASAAQAQPTPLQVDEDRLGPIEDTAPTIELLTFGVGEVIFEKFGHAAICLRYHDPRNLPVCFNYGVTNFDAGSALIWSFLRSKQKFWVEPTPYGELYTGDDERGMLGFYSWEDRDIWVQTLPLTSEQARAIEARLWRNIQPRNRYYIYDHFLDNCTTRLRDMIDDVTGGALRVGGETRYPLTYRELARRGLAEMPPLIAITDFVAGRQLDRHPTIWQAMFHPDELRRHVEVALGAKPHLLYARRGPPFPTDGSTGRLGMFAIALAVTLPLLLGRWRRRFERSALILASLYLALWGLVVWALVILSPIEGLRWNEVVVVVVPFDLALPFLTDAKRRRYAQVRVGLLVLVSLLRAIGVFDQPLWIPILTVFLPMSVLAFYPTSAPPRTEVQE